MAGVLSRLWRGKPSGPNSASNEPASGSKTKSTRASSAAAPRLDPSEWVAGLADGDQVDVFAGANYLKRVDAMTFTGDDPVEEVLLRNIGAGAYRLVPYRDGRRYESDALRVRVGPTEQSFTATPKAGEIDALKDMIAELKAELAEKQRPAFPLESVMTAATGLITTLLGAVKSDGSSKIVEKMLEATLSRSADPITEALVKKALADKGTDTFDQMSRYEQMRSSIKAELEESLGSSATAGLAPLLAQVVAAVTGGGGRQDALPAFAGVESQPVSEPPMPPGNFLIDQMVRQWQSKLARLAHKGDADAIARHLWTGYEAASDFGMEHPLLAGFPLDPGETFDKVIDPIAIDGDVRAEARRLVIERAETEFGVPAEAEAEGDSDVVIV